MMTASHTTIVFVRYILLEWNMDLTNALQRLMTLFVNITQTFSSAITEMIKNQVSNWMTSQASFIQAMFRDLC